MITNYMWAFTFIITLLQCMVVTTHTECGSGYAAANYIYAPCLECVAIDCGLALFDDLYAVVISQELMTETCSSHPLMI